MPLRDLPGVRDLELEQVLFEYRSYSRVTWHHEFLVSSKSDIYYYDQTKTVEAISSINSNRGNREVLYIDAESLDLVIFIFNLCLACLLSSLAQVSISLLWRSDMDMTHRSLGANSR